MILIIGSAPNYIEDMTAAKAMFPGAMIMALNFTGMAIDSDAWASVHTQELYDNAAKIGYQGQLLTPENTGIANIGGTSALFASRVVMNVFNDDAVLCGCPMEGTTSLSMEHSLDYESRATRLAWRSCPELIGRVWSMSGWTRNLLGYPPC